MDWTTVLSQKPLLDKSEGLLKSFLLAHLPPFAAPTDPVAWREAAPRLRRRALAEVFLRGFSRGHCRAGAAGGLGPDVAPGCILCHPQAAL